MILAHVIEHALGLGMGPPRVRQRTEETKKGKRRTFYVPNPAMRAVHRSLISYTRKLMRTRFADTLPHITARPGSSFIDNALAHRENRFVYGVDLVRAYHGVRERRFVSLMSSLDKRLCAQPGESRRQRERSLYAFFNRYCFDHRQGGLMEGVPASPDLFNLYCAVVLDRPLAEIARRHALVYTRYIDDLTFSSATPITEEVRQEIRRAIDDAGFWINHKPGKSYRADLRRGQTALITGVRLMWEGEERPARLYLGQRYLRRIERMLAYTLANPASENMDREAHEHFNRKLRGLWQIYRQTTLANARRTTRDRRLIANYRAYRTLNPA